jgi:uncharacterized protein YcbX
MEGRVVSELSVALVKGMRLAHPEFVMVEPSGVSDDRRFFLIAADGRQYDARLGPLQAVVPALNERGSLDLRFPDGDTVSGPVVLGERTSGRVTWDGDRPIAGRRVVGPWSDALSQYLGERVELLEAVESRRAIDVAPITILGDGSVARLERELDTRLGTRRFRMTVTLSGLEAHEEDTWYGRTLEIGGCRLRVDGPVPRCAATTHEPRTGVRDHATLRGIVAYRAPIEMPDGSVVKAPFGVYASVERPGPIRVGDPARLLPGRAQQ